MIEQAAFIQLIKEHEGVIYKITRLYTDHDEDQKDLYQEIVYQLWKSLHSFKSASKVSTWIYKVALNTSITYLKKNQKRRSMVPIDFELTNWTEEIDNIDTERIEIMYAQIKKLNLVDKGIILLYLEDKSYSEIAEITGFSVSNIGTRLNRIKNKMKNQISILNE